MCEAQAPRRGPAEGRAVHALILKGVRGSLGTHMRLIRRCKHALWRDEVVGDIAPRLDKFVKRRLKGRGKLQPADNAKMPIWQRSHA
jgi:hypothetical protein